MEIWMDHKNLEYFMIAKKLNYCQARWSLYLTRFDFKLAHHPGHSMDKLDTLLQRLDHDKGASDNEDIVLPWPELFTIWVLEGV